MSDRLAHGLTTSINMKIRINMKTLHFWTDGQAMTGLLEDLYRSGEFKKFEAILIDAGLPEHRIKEAFLFRMVLTGSTNDAEGMQCSFNEASPEDFSETLYYSILTALRSIRREEFVDYRVGFLDVTDNLFKNDKDIEVILKYLDIKELKQLCWRLTVGENYEITTLYDAISKSDNSVSGLLLRTGVFVQCGFQGHAELYPVLSSLDLLEGEDRLNSDALSISSNMLSGTLAFDLQRNSFNPLNRYSLTDRQMEELWKLKDHKLSHYSRSGRESSVNEQLLTYLAYKKGLGGKFGNLEFLKKFYPEIPLANYSRTPDSGWKTTIVRTSPKRSLPGLLNSIKASSEQETIKAVKKILSDFEKHENVIVGNSIYWFFQEFMEGQNGVVNCIEKPMDRYPRNLSPEYTDTLKYDIDIACSSEQGSIVEGHIGNIDVGEVNSTYLRRLVRKLAGDFDADIQLEFVILPNEEVRIVQLRVLQNKPNKISEVPENYLEEALLIGKSFSSPEYGANIKVELSDILIVEQDCASEMLLGKKALIVENDTNFSHILALSKALGIPSMYATGKAALNGKNEFIFSTEYSTGYIK